MSDHNPRRLTDRTQPTSDASPTPAPADETHRLVADGGISNDPPAGFPARLAAYWTALVDLEAFADGTPDDWRAVGVTSTELAESDTGSTNDRSNASRNLKKLADDDGTPITRRADGNSYHYWIDTADGESDESDTDADESDESDTDATTDATGGVIPHIGGQPTHADEIPADVPEYADPSDILLSVRSLMTEKARQKGDSPASIRLVGHTGAGKTHAVRWVAQQADAATVTLQCEEGTDATDILGESVPVGGDWQWRDGAVTEAFRLSHDGLTVLMIDEFNRMRPEAAAATMSALGRGVIELAERNETVTADPSNLVIVGTQNPPTAEYTGTFDGDFAQTRRWGATKNVPYLGVSHFDRAAEVTRRESPDTTPTFAELVVDTANELRAFCDADADASAVGGAAMSDPTRDVRRPVPTGAVKETIDRADMLAAVGHPDPALEAAQQAILETIYAESDAHDWIAQRLNDRFAGVDPHAFDGAGDGETHTPHRAGDAGPGGA